MMQIINPDRDYSIRIQTYDIPDNTYLAWIEGEEYKGIKVQANSLEEVLKELSISIKVLELHRKNTKK